MNDETPQNANGIAGKPLQPTVNANGNTYESLQAANALPQNESAPRDPASVDLHKEGPIPTLRTYQSDIAEVIRSKQGSVIKVAVAEQEHKKLEPVTYTDTKRSVYILGLSIILIVGSGMAFTIFYIINNRIQEEIQLPQILPPKIITTEKIEDIKLAANETMGTAMRQAKTHISGTPNSLIRYNFFNASDVTGTLFPAETFLTRLSNNIPGAFIRSLHPEFVAGYHLFEEGHAYIIFTVSSYENAFAGMLEWEKTIAEDMRDIIPSSAAIGDSGTFQDTIIKNKDVRMLKNSRGTPLIMYSFPNKQTLIITTHEETFKEIITRLTTSQFIQ